MNSNNIKPPWRTTIPLSWGLSQLADQLFSGLMMMNRLAARVLHFNRHLPDANCSGRVERPHDILPP